MFDLNRERSEEPGEAGKIVVRVCTGTTCFVMGAAELESIGSLLPPEVAAKTEIVGSHCLGYCKGSKYNRAPCVEIDGAVVSRATLPDLVREIEKLVLSK